MDSLIYRLLIIRENIYYYSKLDVLKLSKKSAVFKLKKTQFRIYKLLHKSGKLQLYKNLDMIALDINLAKRREKKLLLI